MAEELIDKYDTEHTAPTERIKQLLKERGITQQDIANKFGKSLINIKKTLNNSNSMTTSNLKRYADLLNVPIWQLFVSPEEVAMSQQFIAFVRCNNETFTATSPEDLIKIMENLGYITH